MTKSSTASMDTHLDQEVTTLATAALITRIDGQIFRVTTAAEAIKIDIGDGLGEQIYSASEGIARTNIASNAELSSDNLDILGVFDSLILDETDLRRGLFDFADFKLFVLNHQDTSTAMGIVKMFRGQFGEVVVTEQQTFRVTVRSLVQFYNKETGEHYSKDCRADLGDIRCTVPIFPDFLPTATPLTLGQVFRIPVNPDPTGCSAVIMNFEGADGSTTFTNDGTEIDGTANGDAQIDTAQFFGGLASGLFDGTGDFVEWVDATWQDIGANEFTIQGRVRLNTIGIVQTIVSKWEETTSDRSYYLRLNASNQVEFSWSLNGTSIAGTITSTTTLSAGGSFTHLAVTRDVSNNIRLFIGGTQEGGTVVEAGTFHNSDEPFRIGALESGGAVTQFFDGWIDNFEFINSFPRWTANFTPPTGLLATESQTYIWEDFGDRLYEVTTAGTSADCVAVPDTTVTNTHLQGGATLTANHSWMRFAQVTAVSSTPRRIFTVTELTPNSGQTVGANRLPSALGFPDDWMNGGGVLFETGDDAGIAGEVRDFIADDGITITQDIELFEDMPFNIQIGDKLRIYAGCDKTNPVCIAKFNNGINFVAEPYVPGSDILGQYPDAR